MYINTSSNIDKGAKWTLLHRGRGILLYNKHKAFSLTGETV